MKFSAKYILVFVVAIFATKLSYAQPGKSDKVEALKVSFITEKISLTPQEAQSFWPLYNEYNDKIKFARKNFRHQYNAVTDFKTDKEADEFRCREGLANPYRRNGLKDKDQTISGSQYSTYEPFLAQAIMKNYAWCI